MAPRIAADLAEFAEPPVRVSVVADDDDPTSFHLELAQAGSYVVRFWVAPPDGKEEAALVEVFDQILDSCVFEDTTDPWPICARHPHDGHSLAPAVRHARAVWECPIDSQVLCTIGALNSPEQ